ncbi:MAG: ATP-binding protein [Prevotella sp.]|nr:ATP-binding protein [Prevotella sp.]
MTKDSIKYLISYYQDFVSGITFEMRQYELEPSANYVFVGLRRAGKSYLMYQHIHSLLAAGHSIEEILYFNFEDDRIDIFNVSELDLIKTCYEEMYGHRPIFFLDEIQNIKGWEKFARRLADTGYRVYITGSNAKMLSSEIATTLGGRYLIKNVYPFSFNEYLSFRKVDMADKNAIYKYRSGIMRSFEEYFYGGGLPETLLMKDKRSWISSLFNKIFFGDLVARHQIRNDFALKLMIRKLAESVKQPTSYNRIANIVSTAGKKISVDTVIDYIAYLRESWLILPFENLSARLSERESNKKYYFVDNGLLGLFLIDANTSLLENIVAISLRKQYEDNVFFYNKNIEVDFVVPDDGLAIQVAYSLADPTTEKRETDALMKFNAIMPMRQLIIITKDEEMVIEKDGTVINVLPVWKWLLR